MTSGETLYSMYIIGKSGSLLYCREFESSQRRISPNDRLFLASTFHALHALSASCIGPKESQKLPSSTSASTAPSSAATMSDQLNDTREAESNFVMFPQNMPLTPFPGITTIEAEHFKLHCLQTLTGNKFMIVTSPTYSQTDTVLKKIAVLFCDYALKNPFYEVGMPVRCELFDKHLINYVTTLQWENAKERPLRHDMRLSEYFLYHRMWCTCMLPNLGILALGYDPSDMFMENSVRFSLHYYSRFPAPCAVLPWPTVLTHPIHLLALWNSLGPSIWCARYARRWSDFFFAFPNSLQ